jgi:hypothetical protein
MVTAIGQTSKHVVAEGNNWLALAVLLAGAFMALLDTTIVNVAVTAALDRYGFAIAVRFRCVWPSGQNTIRCERHRAFAAKSAMLMP